MFTVTVYYRAHHSKRRSSQSKRILLIPLDNYVANTIHHWQTSACIVRLREDLNVNRGSVWRRIRPWFSRMYMADWLTICGASVTMHRTIVAVNWSDPFADPWSISGRVVQSPAPSTNSPPSSPSFSLPMDDAQCVHVVDHQQLHFRHFGWSLINDGSCTLALYYHDYNVSQYWDSTINKWCNKYW